MSDIAGPPAPKPVSPVSHGTDRTGKVSRDPNETPRQTTDDSGDKQSKSEQREQVQVRDPAVSISASAAHLRIGDELKEQVREVDNEGRPIIVTETATFALRPDAGLRPGDDVVLQVKDTGKTVAADLLRQNARVIDPPIRLSLIVIAVHTPESQGVQRSESAAHSEKLDVAYKPTRPAQAPATSTVQVASTAPDAESIAKLIARGDTAAIKPATTGVADNPDPLVKSNSSDLATLIAAQQNPAGTIAKPGAPTNPTGSPLLNPGQQPPGVNITNSVVAPPAAGPQSGAEPPFSTPTTSTHIIPPSPLTEVTQSQVSAPTASAVQVPQQGLGAAIQALTLSGAPAQIQLMDPAVSQVPPNQVAEVISVQPLPASVARSLPAGAQALGNDALAQMETSKGTFVLALAKATALAGELVRIQQPVAEAPTAELVKEPAKIDLATYAARLTSPGTQGGRQVQVQFVPQAQAAAVAANTSQSHILTTVEAIHTTRAFLTGDGPRNDLRIDTPFGTLTTTLATNVRPAVGDTVAILPNTTAATVGAVEAAAVGATPVASPAGWPTFEEAYALVQSGAPAAAGALAARSAQGGPKLLNSMVFLMAALKGGSPAGWLGKTAETALENRSGSLLQQLKEELGRLFNAGTETATEWRSMVLPFDTRSPDMPMLAALFSQPGHVDPDAEDGSGDTDPEREEDQRFIIEVQFSVLGAIQLDGVVRKNRFDLTLWSNTALPAPLTEDTSQLFATALDANGFTGALRFKQSDTFPVDVAAILQKQLAA